ncbi:MAG: sensor histidine kinase [Lachnospiraceae bacterium]|nr:sensor histidine kinase [Lachnospiraceae bacterium]
MKSADVTGWEKIPPPVTGEEQEDIAEDIINMKSHDLRYHIDQYKKENHLEEHEQFFREVESAVNVYDNLVPTGNTALDALLSEKLLYAGAKGVDVSYMINAEALRWMNPSDVYSLFGNALDNALEAELKEESPNRSISLSVKNVLGCTHIVVENYCSVQPEMANGLPISTKGGSNHGIGTRSIRHIVEKYDGSMEIGTSNNLYTLTILFPSVSGSEREA